MLDASSLVGTRPAPTLGHALSLAGITHRYGGFLAVQDVSLDIVGGSLTAFLGPSGCGKSTLLRAIAGFIRPQSGTIAIDGAGIDHLAPNRRGIGFVFQNYALFPHLTVAENVAYGPEAQGLRRADVRARVDDMLRLVQMEPYAKRLPRELSGGQQQRIALARVLAARPRLLLLDEPFGALDKNLRLGMQIEVKRLQRELGITTVMVTHDQEEALSMADRIAVMSEGRVEQLGTPEDIYDRPQTLFVANFVGTANLFSGRLARDGERFSIALDAGGTLSIDAASPCSRAGRVRVSVRPEQLVFAPLGPGTLPATVELALPLGPSVVCELALDNGEKVKVTLARTSALAGLAAGTRTGLALSPGAPVAVFQA